MGSKEIERKDYRAVGAKQQGKILQFRFSTHIWILREPATDSIIANRAGEANFIPLTDV